MMPHFVPPDANFAKCLHVVFEQVLTRLEDVYPNKELDAQGQVKNCLSTIVFRAANKTPDAASHRLAVLKPAIARHASDVELIFVSRS